MTTAVPTTAVPTTAVPTNAPPTNAPPTNAPPTSALPTSAPPTNAIPTPMISVPEAAERLALPAADVYRLIDARSLPAFKDPRGLVVVPDGAVRAAASKAASLFRSSND